MLSRVEHEKSCIIFGNEAIYSTLFSSSEQLSLLWGGSYCYCFYSSEIAKYSDIGSGAKNMAIGALHKPCSIFCWFVLPMQLSIFSPSGRRGYRGN